MCGIVGYVGGRSARGIVVDRRRRLGINGRGGGRSGFVSSTMPAQRCTIRACTLLETRLGSPSCVASSVMLGAARPGESSWTAGVGWGSTGAEVAGVASFQAQCLRKGAPFEHALCLKLG